MESGARELAAVTSSNAYQVGEYLLIRVAGEKPNGCYKVRLERSLLTVEPPAFLATWSMPPNIRCVPEAVPYEHQQVFRVGIMRDAVTLHHADGEASVAVEDLGSGDEGAIEEIVTPTATSGWEVIPARIEAVGFSRNFDYGEALRDAISKIPTPDLPDWLATYTVLEVGAEMGGVAGFFHMFVRVEGG